MTVCVAAITDNGKKLILAADNMLTVSIGGTMQYEKEDAEHKKIYQLNSQTWALGAGTTNFIDSIIKEAKKDIGVNQKPVNVADKVKLSYQKFYLGMAEDSVLKKHGLNWDAFNKDQKNLDPQTVKNINDELNGIKPDVLIIVAGYSKEDDNECYLGTVGGYTLVDRTIEGFCTVGNGGDFAKYSLLLSDYSKTLPIEKAEELVKKAIKDAARSPGVGQLGDYFVVPK